MKIGVGNNSSFVDQFWQAGNKTGTGNAGDGSFATALAANDADNVKNSAGSVKNTDAKKNDFTNMTSRQMLDWDNSQISSGSMSFDESTTFVSMSLHIPVDGSQPMDSSTDSARCNYMEKARSGIAGALSRNARKEAKQLEDALGLMQKIQG